MNGIERQGDDGAREYTRPRDARLDLLLRTLDNIMGVDVTGLCGGTDAGVGLGPDAFRIGFEIDPLAGGLYALRHIARAATDLDDSRLELHFSEGEPYWDNDERAAAGEPPDERGDLEFALWGNDGFDPDVLATQLPHRAGRLCDDCHHEALTADDLDSRKECR